MCERKGRGKLQELHKKRKTEKKGSRRRSSNYSVLQPEHTRSEVQKLADAPTTPDELAATVEPPAALHRQALDLIAEESARAIETAD